MRKGQAEMIKWFPRLIMMVIAVVVIALIVRHYANRDVDGADVARAAYISRIYYDDIIMYADAETKRVYPGVIDRSKFTETVLNDVFGTHGMIASRLELTTGGESIVIYNDKQTYEQYIGFAKARVKGRGSATYETIILPVSVRTGYDVKPGVLNITVVRKGGVVDSSTATTQQSDAMPYAGPI